MLHKKILPKKFFKVGDRVKTWSGYFGRITKKLPVGLELDGKIKIHIRDIKRVIL